MKGFFKFTTAALALVAFASCSNDDLLGGSQAANGQAENALQVEIEDLVDPVTSRAAYVPNGTANQLYWENYDRIIVSDETLLQNDTYEFSEKRATFENNSKDLVKTPAFAFTDNACAIDSKYWDTTTDQVVVNYEIPANPTTGVNNEIASTKGNKVKAYKFSLPMWGQATKTDKGVSVSMKYLTGVLRVQLSQLPSNWGQIRIRAYEDQAAANEARLTGVFKAVISEDDEIDQDAQLVVPTPAEISGHGWSYGNTLRVNFGEYDADELIRLRAEGGYIYLPLIAQKYGTLLFEYYDPNTSTWKLYKKTKPIEVKRGVVYRMNIEEFEIAGSDAESLNVLLQQKKDESGAVTVKTTYPTEMRNNDISDKKNVISIPAGFKAETLTLDLKGINGSTGNPFELESEDGKYAGDVVIDLSDGTVTSLSALYLNLPNSNVTLKGNFKGANLGNVSQNKLIVKSLTIAAIDEDSADKGYGATYLGSIYPNYESFATGDGITVNEGATVGNIEMTSISENKDKFIKTSKVVIYGKAGDIKAALKDPAYTANKKQYYQDVPVTVEGGTAHDIETASAITLTGATVNDAISKFADITATEETKANTLTAEAENVTMNASTAADVTAKKKAELTSSEAKTVDAATVALKGASKVTTSAGTTANTAALSIEGTSTTADAASKGTATVNLSAEGEAVSGTLTLAKATLTLTQGYINAIAGTSAKVTYGANEGLTAIASATGLEATNASTWNGTKITAKKYAAYTNLADVWTAAMLATNNFKAGITLQANIDLNNQAWTAVADPGAVTIDGKEKAIKNLKVTAADDKGTALIKSTASAVTIQDLTIDGATIAASGKNNAAVLVGSATDALTITNVTLKNAAVTGKYLLGGVAGTAADITVTKSNLTGVTFTASAAKTTVTTDDTANTNAGSVGFAAGKATGAVTISDTAEGTLDKQALGYKENFKTQTDSKGVLRFYYYNPGTTLVGIFGGTVTTSGAFDGYTDKAGALVDAVVAKGLNYYLLNSAWTK